MILDRKKFEIFRLLIVVLVIISGIKPLVSKVIITWSIIHKRVYTRFIPYLVKSILRTIFIVLGGIFLIFYLLKLMFKS